MDLTAFHEMFQVLAIKDSMNSFLYDSLKNHDIYAVCFHHFGRGVPGAIDEQCSAIVQRIGKRFPSLLTSAGWRSSSGIDKDTITV